MSARPVFRDLPRLVWLAVAIFGATMTVWTVTLPTYRSADEYNHVSAAIYWEQFGNWPGFKQLPQVGSIGTTVQLSLTRRDGETNPALDVDDLLARPSFSQISTGIDPGWINEAGQHPPGYYIMLGTVYGLLPADLSFDSVVWVFRFISVLLLLPLPLLAAALARQFGAPRGVVVAAAFAPLLVPQLAVLGGAVNNDNLLSAAAAWATLGSALVLRGDLRIRTGAWIGAVLAIALFTKAFALPIALGVAIAYAVSAVRTRRFARAAAALGATIAVASLGGWWWVRNLFVYGDLQPAGHYPALAGGPLGLGDMLGPIAERFVRLFPPRFWAFMSIKSEAPFPPWIPLALTGLLIAVLIAAIARRRTFEASRADVLALLAPAAMTMGVLVVSVSRLALRTGVVAGVQGRYLFATILGILVVAVLAVAAYAGRLRRWLPLAVVVLGTAFTSASIVRGMGYHWGPDHSLTPARDFRALLTFSPLPAPLVVMLFAGYALLVIGAVASVAVHAWRERPAAQTS